MPRLLRRLPRGTSYLNVGHANLGEKALACLSRAGLSVTVLIHDTIPLDHPQFARPGTVEPFRARLAAVSAHASRIIHLTEATRRLTEAQLALLGRVPPGLVAPIGVDLAAPDHHEDEERHVFPRLLAGNDENVKTVVRRLQQDHRDMTANWVSAREVLHRVSEGSAPTWSGLGEADRATLARFADLYADHIRAEEDTVYPAASALIDAPELQRMGAEMAGRRTARS